MADYKTFVIAAGGTGGHLFPGQALAHYLIEKGHHVVLMTDKRFAPYSKGFGEVEVKAIPTGRPVGNVIKKAIAAVQVLMGIAVARAHLQRLKPAAVIGFGGYPAYPTLVAAFTLKLPTVVHEQNILMGRANRRLATHISKIATTFPNTQKIQPQDSAKVTVTGNPIRKPVRDLYSNAYEPPKVDAPIHLLVFGGSQGAHIFSEVVPEALGKLPESLRDRLRVTQQVRQEDLTDARARFNALGIEAELAPFFDNMQAKLAKAHLVIGRAGASTCMELAVASRPAIYVPLPYAMENHQYLNAKYMEDAGAGWVIEQKDFTADALAQKLGALLNDTQMLEDTARAAHRIAIPDATEKLAELVLKSA